MNWKHSELFLGKLYLGCVMRIVPEGWREFSSYKKPYDGKEEFIKSNIEKSRKYYEANEAAPWRGWIMSSEDGEEVGKYAFREDAMAALEHKANELMKE
jgi:hypothetical protein